MSAAAEPGADTHEAVARRFARAAEARDADALAEIYAADARFWSNVIGRTSTTADALEITRREAEIIRDYRFEDLRVTLTVDGFVIQTTVTGTTRSGADFRAPVCLVGSVRDDGRISAIDEYVDSKAVAPIFAELLGGASS